MLHVLCSNYIDRVNIEEKGMTINKELFLEVTSLIRNDPTRLNMSALIKESKYCGTTACIGGWAILLSKEKSSKQLMNEWGLIDYDLPEHWIETASRVLGIECWQGRKLFFSPHWPRPYLDRFYSSADRQGQADAAADLLEDFANGKVTLTQGVEYGS